MGRVVVVGSANVDIVTRVERLPIPGETVLADESVTLPGGKGANQAVAASRLGAEAILYAATGADAFAERVRDGLRADGVVIDHVRAMTDNPTGIALIEVAADGTNTIVVASGANRALDADAIGDLDDVLSAGDVVVLQLEIPIETSLDAAGAARRSGATVVLNAAPLAYAADALFDKLLRSVDVLVANEIEALALAEPALAAAVAESADGRHDASWRPKPDASPEWTDIADAVRRRGPEACVITLGAGGAVVRGTTDGWHQPPFPARVIDTTGAGDAFVGALAASLAGGATLAAAVRDGCAAGALATEKLGAQSAMPTRADVDRLIGGPDRSTTQTAQTINAGRSRRGPAR